jgi:hypothetical protein
MVLDGSLLLLMLHLLKLLQLNLVLLLWLESDVLLDIMVLLESYNPSTLLFAVFIALINGVFPSVYDLLLLVSTSA